MICLNIFCFIDFLVTIKTEFQLLPFPPRTEKTPEEKDCIKKKGETNLKDTGGGFPIMRAKAITTLLYMHQQIEYSSHARTEEHPTEVLIQLQLTAVSISNQTTERHVSP